MSKLYRYSDSVSDYGVIIDRINIPNLNVEVYILEYAVIRSTPCGSWIQINPQRRRFVNHTCIKQYAYKTKEEAKRGFIRRKERQIVILSGQLQYARDALDVVLNGTPVEYVSEFRVVGNYPLP